MSAQLRVLKLRVLCEVQTCKVRVGVTDLRVRVLGLTLRVLKLRVLIEVQTCKVRVADSAPNGQGCSSFT